MTDEGLDDLPLADEAKLEASSKAVRRGIAALRGTRRSNYLRRPVRGELVDRDFSKARSARELRFYP